MKIQSKRTGLTVHDDEVIEETCAELYGISDVERTL